MAESNIQTPQQRPQANQKTRNDHQVATNDEQDSEDETQILQHIKQRPDPEDRLASFQTMLKKNIITSQKQKSDESQDESEQDEIKPLKNLKATTQSKSKYIDSEQDEIKPSQNQKGRSYKFNQDDTDSDSNSDQVEAKPSKSFKNPPQIKQKYDDSESEEVQLSKTLKSPTKLNGETFSLENYESRRDSNHKTELKKVQFDETESSDSSVEEDEVSEVEKQLNQKVHPESLNKREAEIEAQMEKYQNKFHIDSQVKKDDSKYIPQVQSKPTITNKPVTVNKQSEFQSNKKVLDSDDDESDMSEQSSVESERIQDNSQSNSESEETTPVKKTNNNNVKKQNQDMQKQIKEMNKLTAFNSQNPPKQERALFVQIDQKELKQSSKQNKQLQMLQQQKKQQEQMKQCIFQILNLEQQSDSSESSDSSSDSSESSQSSDQDISSESDDTSSDQSDSRKQNDFKAVHNQRKTPHQSEESHQSESEQSDQSDQVDQSDSSDQGDSSDSDDSSDSSDSSDSIDDSSDSSDSNEAVSNKFPNNDRQSATQNVLSKVKVQDQQHDSSQKRSLRTQDANKNSITCDDQLASPACKLCQTNQIFSLQENLWQQLANKQIIQQLVDFSMKNLGLGQFYVAVSQKLQICLVGYEFKSQVDLEKLLKHFTGSSLDQYQVQNSMFEIPAQVLPKSFQVEAQYKPEKRAFIFKNFILSTDLQLDSKSPLAGVIKTKTIEFQQKQLSIVYEGVVNQKHKFHYEHKEGGQKSELSIEDLVLPKDNNILQNLADQYLGGNFRNQVEQFQATQKQAYHGKLQINTIATDDHLAVSFNLHKSEQQ